MYHGTIDPDELDESQTIPCPPFFDDPDWLEPEEVTVSIDYRTEKTAWQSAPDPERELRLLEEQLQAEAGAPSLRHPARWPLPAIDAGVDAMVERSFARTFKLYRGMDIL